MEVKQIFTIMNTVTNEVLGKTDLVKEDLSNIVDVGTEIFNADAVDNYVRSLVDHIGKVVFVNRPYTGIAPSVLMDGNNAESKEKSDNVSAGINGHNNADNNSTVENNVTDIKTTDDSDSDQKDEKGSNEEHGNNESDKKDNKPDDGWIY